MNPQTAQNLMNENKDVKEFISFMLQEMKKLETINDIETNDPTLVAIEVKARKLAYKKIEDIIKPMISLENEKVVFNKKEYIV